MKKIVTVILLVTVLLGGVFFLAFTPNGNALFLPYINNYLKENVKGAKVELLKLSLKPDYLTAVAKVNDSVNVVAKGPLNLLDQSFDLNYTLDAQEIKSQGFHVDKPLHVQGKVTGKAEDMHISGSGKAFASAINYDLNLKENQAQNIKFNLQDASIAEVLAVAGEKPYAKGHMSIDVNMPTLDPNHPQGKAHLKIKDAVIDAATLKKAHQITLPSNTPLQADISAQTEGKMILAKGNIITTLASLALNETRYHMQTRKLDTNYLLDVPDISRFKSVLNMPLGGKLKLKGEVSLLGEKLTATGLTHSFGGESRFAYKEDTLTATLKEVEIAKLLKMLGEPQYVRGKLSANLNLDSLQKPSGKFDLKSSGSAVRAVIKKTQGIDLGKHFKYTLASSGKIKNAKVYTQTKLDTTMAKLSMPNAIYDPTSGSLHTSYHLYMSDLRKLQPLTGKAYRGNMDFKGKISKEKDLVITGEGKEFDGNVKYRLVNEKVKADVHGATVSKVMYMLGYPQVLEALSEAKVDYNFATQRGKVDAKLDSARILPNQLTMLLKQMLKIDWTRERYNQVTFVSTMTPTRFNFNFIAQNPISHFKILNGILEKRSERLNASVDMQYKKKSLKAKITGTLKHPKVALDASALIKSKLNSKVDTLIDKKFKGKQGEQIKGLLKGFLD